MQNNLAKIETFDAIAKALKDTTTNAKALKDDKTSLTKSLGWSAFYIMARGDEADKLALQNLTSKEGMHHALRGVVSKAKTVLHALQEYESLTATAAQVVYSLEGLLALPSDAMPEGITIGTLYEAAQPMLKVDKKEDAREKAILTKARQLAEEKLGFKPTEKQLAAMPDKNLYMQEAERCILTQEALAGASTREEAVRAIVAQIVHLNCLNEVLAILENDAKFVQSMIA